jgi:predicted lysophospholipase L1 biosynthesis ABC-type transport system permease subunit
MRLILDEFSRDFVPQPFDEADADRVQSRDLLSFTIAGAALLGATVVAALIPARRAIRVDPVAVLRAD